MTSIEKIDCVFDTAIDITIPVSKPISDLLSALKANPKGVRYADAIKVAEHFFGKGRRSGGSHTIFKMNWQGDPRVNLQEGKNGEAKAYQVRQLLEAIEKKAAMASVSTQSPPSGKKGKQK